LLLENNPMKKILFALIFVGIALDADAQNFRVLRLGIPAFSISGDTLYITQGDTTYAFAGGATNLTFSGASSPVSLLSSTGTDVVFTAGTGIGLSQAGNNLTITNSASSVNIYNSDGSIPAATNRVVTVPTDSDLDFTRGNYNLGYYTTGLSSSGTGQGWASKFFTSATNFSEVFAGTQITPRAGIRTIVGTTRNLIEATNTSTLMETRNTSTNNAGAFSASTTNATISQIIAGTTARQFVVGDGFLYAWDTNPVNIVIYPSLRPGSNSYWRYNADGTGQYVSTTSVGVTDLTFSGSASPVMLNSSSGTDVTLTAGTNVTFSQAGNNLTINSSGGGAGTDLGVTGASSPLTVTSSTGTDIMLTAGSNVTLAGSGGNNATITAADANLAFSGASSPVSLTSSTGTDVTLTAGTGISLSQAANNLTISAPGPFISDLTWLGTNPNFLLWAGGTTAGLTMGTNMSASAGGNVLTLNATGDGNGIYGGSGNVPTGTSATLVGTLNFTTPSGNGLYLNNSGFHSLGQSGGNLFTVNATSNLYTFGSTVSGTNAVLRLYNADGDLFGIRASAGAIPYTLVMPDNGDNAMPGDVITSLGGGVTTFAPPSGGITNLTFTGSASPVSLNSSSGTDVTLTAGTNVTFSQAGNNLTINSSGGGSTDLGVSGASSPLTVTSSTGTDITLTAGTNVTLTGSGGNNATITAADANLAFSGASSPVSLTSSTGTDVSIVAGTNVTLSQAANALTINAGNTDLAITGTSSPLTLTSSTGSDITLTAGTNVTLTGSGGNNVTIASTGGTTDLTFSGSASPVTLNSSSGTDVTITAGTGLEFSQAGNNLTINASDAINAIRGVGTGNTDASGYINVGIVGLTSTSTCVCSGRVTTGPVVIYCTPEYLGEDDVLKIFVRNNDSTGSAATAGTFASFSYICYK